MKFEVYAFAWVKAAVFGVTVAGLVLWAGGPLWLCVAAAGFASVYSAPFFVMWAHGETVQP